ncbi:hypothetical protein V1477_019371 [Vespula maculifrons]|uniref:Uncharacterized protein n=1 Tax=Vespula maculifrons TaxID=7453 RepID=A0ABD2AUB1_VESMC
MSAEKNTKKNEEVEFVSSNCSQAINKNTSVTDMSDTMLNNINLIPSTSSDTNPNVSVFFMKTSPLDENISNFIIQKSEEHFKKKNNVECIDIGNSTALHRKKMTGFDV